MAATGTPRSTTAGWSSMCVAGSHAMCSAARARCACDCHGAGGQQPPPPARPTPPTKETTVTDRTAAPLVAIEGGASTGAAGAHRCDECGFTADRPQSLGAHRWRAHGVRGRTRLARPAPPTKPKRTGAAPAKAELADGGCAAWLVVVATADGHYVCTDLGTEAAARDVSRVLAAIGHRPAVYRRVEG